MAASFISNHRHDVGYWHIADNPTAPANVRFRTTADKRLRWGWISRQRLTQSGHAAFLGTTGSDARTERYTSRPSVAKCRHGNDELLVVTTVFPRFTLSSEIQTPSGPSSIDSLIAHDQTDPGAYDLWISQIDILTNQPCCALALCIDESSARSTIPVE